VARLVDHHLQMLPGVHKLLIVHTSVQRVSLECSTTWTDTDDGYWTMDQNSFRHYCPSHWRTFQSAGNLAELKRL